MGLSQYYTNKFKDAQVNFQALEGSKNYGNTVPYYITQIKFILKDYQGTIDYAEPKLPKTTFEKSCRNEPFGG
ncbi:MAG: hypothetical protein IPN93_17805 [Bacteroidetes bacterium]|nr:hypothetical protein [Bacteroidota bacterium]